MPAHVGRVNERAAIRIDLGHKNVNRSAVFRLDGIDDWKIGGLGCASYVGIASRVHSNTIGIIG